ncbi:hypothetical protein LOZ66_006816 [Ophidiomyces ophidiicola]|nr:hypothetical protein LOZ66_006816 [Ophidiomyces ophidiicola]
MITQKGFDSKLNRATRARQIAEDTTNKLDCLIESQHRKEIETELAGVFERVFEVQDRMRRDTCRLRTNMQPPRTNDGMWSAIEPPTTSSNGVATTSVAVPDSFAIFPRIVGDFDLDEDLRETQEKVVHGGIGLFSDSPLFDLGYREFKDLQSELKGWTIRRHSSISSPTAVEHRPPLIFTGTMNGAPAIVPPGVGGS